MVYVLIGIVVLFIIGFAVKSLGKHSEKFANINVEDFKKKITAPDTVVLDVRTPQEMVKGKIKGAVAFNVLDRNFMEKTKTLDPSKTYLVYCRSGSRSAKACRIMVGAGMENVYNLVGGYQAWRRNS